MNATSLTPILSRPFLDELAGAMLTVPAGALLTLPMVHLHHLPALVVTPDTPLASLTAGECNFSGYTAQAFTGHGPVRLDQSSQAIVGQTLFTATPASPFVQDTVCGYWVQGATGLVAAETFPANQRPNFGNPEEFLTLAVNLPIQSGL